MNEMTATDNAKPITLFTIGFAGKTAEDFFGKLQSAGVKRLIDVRLNNVSQLAGLPGEPLLDARRRIFQTGDGLPDGCPRSIDRP